MSKIIDQLHQDHSNTCKLLELLEIQMLAFDKGETTDFNLMQDIVGYMMEYTDVIHHHGEDILYSLLVERDPSRKALVDELHEEHHELTELTNKFRLTLEEIVLESMLPRDVVSNLGHDYISQNRTHLAKEERSVFPLVIETLTDEDWSQAEASASNKDDPLFGAAVQEKYQALYSHITEAT